MTSTSAFSPARGLQLMKGPSHHNIGMKSLPKGSLPRLIGTNRDYSWIIHEVRAVRAVESTDGYRHRTRGALLGSPYKKDDGMFAMLGRPVF